MAICTCMLILVQYAAGLGEAGGPTPLPHPQCWHCYYSFLKDLSAHAHSCTSGVPSLHTGVGTGTCVSGRIESGHAQVGEGVLLLPANELATIKCM